MNSNSGWRKGKKQKYFPSKAPKRKGNIAEFNQKKVSVNLFNKIITYILKIN